ncbi:hypothetical protein BH23GEM10_BH23GEM10_02390 [soil metagenome]
MRMNTAAVAVLALVVAACGTDDADMETTPGTELPAPVPVETVDMTVASGQFEGVGDAGAQMTGTADLTRLGDTGDAGMKLRVHLMGLAEGDHAWHIHEGTCANRGGVVLPLSDAAGQDGVTGDLKSDGSGMVERTVTLEAEDVAVLTAGQGYSVNVHTAGSDSPGAPVACATIELPADLWGAAGAATQSTGY